MAYGNEVLPEVGQVMGHQSSEMVAGSVLVVEGQQGWMNLPPHLTHLVSQHPDELELPSAATKTHKQPRQFKVKLRRTKNI